MIELKWVKTPDGKELWYRQAFGVDASGALCPGEWSEWEKVRTEHIPWASESEAGD